jgi:hypothetical protein
MMGMPEWKTEEGVVGIGEGEGKWSASVVGDFNHHKFVFFNSLNILYSLTSLPSLLITQIDSNNRRIKHNRHRPLLHRERCAGVVVESDGGGVWRFVGSVGIEIAEEWAGAWVGQEGGVQGEAIVDMDG